MCEESIYACLCIRACIIDAVCHLIGDAVRTALARIAFVCPRRNDVPTQVTGVNMRTVETPSAAGTGWRRPLSQLYQMIEAVETSPLESLYDRVLQLEQEVSALKLNSLINSVDRK